MRSHTLKGGATKIALLALIGTASAPLCMADEYGAPNRELTNMTVTGGQGGYVRLPDLRPVPASYALTGEQSQYRQTLRAWQAVAGPIYSVGNARIVIPPAR